MPHSRRMLVLGDARQVHLSRWVRAFLERGWNVETVTLEPPRADHPGRVHRIRVTESLPHALRYPLAVPALRRIAEAFRPDLIHAHYVTNYGVMAALLGRRPRVVSAWGSDVLVDPGRTPFHRLRTRAVLRGADLVTSDARVMTARIEAMGVPSERVSTFPFGVDTDRFRPGRPPDDGPRIVSVRKLEPLYDVRTAVRALARLRREFPDARLTVAGEGSQRGRLQALAAKLHVADAVTFVGDVAHDRLPALLGAHHVYVSTARSDTTSVSLLEAMACGLYPVVTDIPANREWVEANDAGALVAPGDADAFAAAVARAWREPARLRAARERLPELVRRRADWRAIADEVSQRFAALVDAARTGSTPRTP